jgi:hypothetical protein
LNGHKLIFMTNTTIERLEPKRIDKTRKLLLLGSVVLTIGSIVKILLSNHDKITGIGWWIDTLFFFFAGIFSYITYRKLSNRTGQFIEWKSDIIHYKLKGDTNPITIEKKKIKDITTELTTIEIKDVDGKIFRLDISDFNDYKMRNRVKEKFSE